MDPIKRGRAPADDGDREDADVDSASSSLRQETRKRARISDPQGARKLAKAIRSNTPSSQEDEESSESEDELRVDVDDGVGDYERRLDAGFEHLADEDADTQRATQIIRRRNQRAMDNTPAENGIIESVTCINFKCHTKLHVNLGPLINFIIGHNRSGESAVLTALTVLGVAKQRQPIGDKA